MKKTILLLITLVLAAGIYRLTPATGAIDTGFSAPRAPQILVTTTGRAAFGHPLVPGGIHDVETLTQNKALYLGLIPEHAIFTTAKSGGFSYVSYIKNGVIYWTKHPRYIKAGEPVIVSDGLVILQNCGNMIRSSIPAPVETLFDEPDDLYPPDTVPGDITNFPVPLVPETAVSTPGSATPSIYEPAASFFDVPSGGGGLIPSTVAVSEPPASWFIAFGVLVLFVFLVAVEALKYAKNPRKTYPQDAFFYPDTFGARGWGWVCIADKKRQYIALDYIHASDWTRLAP